MSRKPRFCALLAGALLLCTGCSAEKEIIATPPFWVVENPDNGATLYLLGSMHVGESGLTYPDYVMEAYNSCDTLAVELDTREYEQSELAQAAQHLVLPDGTTMEQLLGEDYEPTVQFLKRRSIYDKRMESFVPYYWCSTLTMDIARECDLYSVYGTESQLLALAHREGKQIAEIESFDKQYAMMAAIPMDIQVMTLLESIGKDNYQSQIDATREMYEDWLYFDEEGLESLNEIGDIPEDMTESYGEFIDLMYNDRQREMAEFALDCLGSGEDVFMMVGAAHFYIGEDILTLLEQEGYAVCAVRS